LQALENRINDLLLDMYTEQLKEEYEKYGISGDDVHNMLKGKIQIKAELVSTGYTFAAVDD